MEAVLSAAERILHHAGAPALRLSRLLEELRHCPAAAGLDAPRLEALLGAHPHRFRVLHPWRGPWRFVVREGEEDALDGEPWVVAVRDDGDGSASREDGPRALRLLRESLRWLAVTLDVESPGGVVRWRGLVLEAQRVDRRRDEAA